MAISKKWNEECEKGMRGVKAELAFLQGELQTMEAAKAAGESTYYFLLTRRRPLFKVLKEFEKSVRLLRSFDAIVPLYDLDENDLNRMEAQPLNFDPRYVFGWSVYERTIVNDMRLRVCFGIHPEQENDVPSFSVELLYTGEEPEVSGRKLLRDIPQTNPKKYTHHQLFTAVSERLGQFVGVYI